MKKTLNMAIGHRFGRLNSGYSNLFGLDDFANVRIGLDYGITNNFTFGIGRSRFDKFHDVFLKYKFLGQTRGAGSFPVTITGLVVAGINGRSFTEQEKELYDFNHRLSYTYQLLAGKRIREDISVLLAPTILHQNLTKFEGEDNLQVSLGAGFRYRLSNTISLMMEYYYRFDQPELSLKTYDPVTIGLDFETFSHIFSVYLTNSTMMAEKQFISETTDDFLQGQLHFGFTISRVFRIP